MSAILKNDSDNSQHNWQQEHIINDYNKTYKYYDVLTSQLYDSLDRDFYKSFTGNRMRILDAGCGTGRVSIRIAAKRRSCVIDAFDSSERMLEVFMNKYEKLQKRLRSVINIIKMDMNDINLSGPYDLIIFPHQSFQVVTGREAQLKILAKIRSILDEKGRIIITLFDPSDNAESSKPVSRLVETIKADNHTYIKIVRDSFIDYDENIHRFKDHVMVFDEKNIMVDEAEDEFKVAYYTHETAERLFTESGFTIEKVCRDYNFNRLIRGEKSFDMIFILKK